MQQHEPRTDTAACPTKLRTLVTTFRKMSTECKHEAWSTSHSLMVQSRLPETMRRAPSVGRTKKEMERTSWVCPQYAATLSPAAPHNTISPVAEPVNKCRASPIGSSTVTWRSLAVQEATRAHACQSMTITWPFAFAKASVEALKAATAVTTSSGTCGNALTDRLPGSLEGAEGADPESTWPPPPPLPPPPKPPPPKRRPCNGAAAASTTCESEASSEVPGDLHGAPPPPPPPSAPAPRLVRGGVVGAEEEETATKSSCTA
mmetsp:Transcript_49800/g.161028  ORF Transcript_49800/g.161028 Transcript_49800/m.161028 type:complete len:261 (+) Transcript_49800:1551-2333(+)